MDDFGFRLLQLEFAQQNPEREVHVCVRNWFKHVHD